MMLSSRRFFLVALICGLLVGVLLFPGISGDFVLDDGSNIVENESVHLHEFSFQALYEVVWSYQPGGISRVLPTISFAVDYWLGGGDAGVFKVTNIVIHAITTCVLVMFLALLFSVAGMRAADARVTALLLALIWAIHPLQVSSVLYVVQRMQTMATLFLLLALHAYLKARQAQLAGFAGRPWFMVAMLWWLLAFGCKEDAVLLPVYTLALELTVLRFGAASLGLASRLRRFYFVALCIGGIVFAALVVPRYWYWDSYPARNFSSYERLLTQGRVLMMYISQILVPLPQNMPFYYDWLQPSRGLLQPWTTLPAWLSLSALLAVAGYLRKRRPVFALGVFLFFASHFVTSNILNLELAFEHRNHFGLIGVVLAVADLFDFFSRRLRFGLVSRVMIVLLVMVVLIVATSVRVGYWADPLRLAQVGVKLAPKSARAWNNLCLGYYKLGGGRVANNPYLGKAVAACSEGADAAPYSLVAITNLVVFKGREGGVTAEDWRRYLDRLDKVTMSPENAQAAWILVNNVRAGVKLDDDQMLAALDIFRRRGSLQAGESTALGYFVLGHSQHPERAFDFFAQAMEGSAVDDPLAAETIAEMRLRGRAGWADEFEVLLRKGKPAPVVAQPAPNIGS